MQVGCVSDMLGYVIESLVVVRLQTYWLVAQRHSDCFFGWSSDGQSVAGFVEVTGGAGVEKGSFYKLRGVVMFEMSCVFATVFVEM